MNTYKSYCVQCDQRVDAIVSEENAVARVRGDEVSFQEAVLTCPLCGSRIGDLTFEEKNLQASYDSYRTKNGIPGLQELKKLRARWGISLREFSLLLGFGVQTYARYERGDLPDKAHATVIRAAMTADGMRGLLAANGMRLRPKTIESISSRLEEDEGSLVFGRTDAPPSTEAEEISLNNGFRSLDSRRLYALAQRLAQGCDNLYYTKFQKAMFLADMLAFEMTTRSITGLMYAHAPRGPVMDRKDEMRWLLVSHGAVTMDDAADGFGELVNPGNIAYDCDFSIEEEKAISLAIDVVNSFHTASAISDFSHSFTGWQGTASGQIIPYRLGSHEVCDAVLKRLDASNFLV